MGNSNITLALFFSYRISLEKWHSIGIIEREMKLYNNLSDFFDKIYIFTYGGKTDKQFSNYCSENIETIPIPFIKRGGDSVYLIPFIFIYSLILPFIHYKILKNVSIIKTNQITGSWTACIAKYLYKKKLIIRCGYVWSIFAKLNKDISIKWFIKRYIERFAVKHADKVICSSQADKKYLAYKNILLNKIHVIPNYVDTVTFKPIVDIKKTENSILYVGRLEPQKNLAMLFDAVSGLPYSLTLLGSGSLKNKLKEKALKNNLNVTFLTNVPHSKLVEIFSQYTLFVLPSLYEGTPKILLEAMSCSMPVIGTDVTGIKDIIINNSNGILAPCEKNMLRNAIISLMNDKELREKLSINARETIIKDFSLKNITTLEKNLYKRELREVYFDESINNRP